MLSISRIVITMILTRVTDGSSKLRGQLIGKRNTDILKAHGSKCQRRCRIELMSGRVYGFASLQVHGIFGVVTVLPGFEVQRKMDPANSGTGTWVEAARV